MVDTRTSDSDSRDAPKRALNYQRLLLFGALFLALTGAGLYAIYLRVAERTISFDSRLLSWQVVTSLLVLLCVYFAADGLRLHYALRALGYRLKLRSLLRLVFINIFVSNVTPLATGGGLAQIWYLRRRRVPMGTAVAATTARTVLAVAFIFSATPIAALLLNRVETASFPSNLLFYLTLFTSAYLAFFAILLFRTRWLLSPANRILRGAVSIHLLSDLRASRWWFACRKETLRFRDAFSTYLSGAPLDVFLSILWTAIFLIALFSFPAVLLWGLGYEPGYLNVLGLMAVTTFVMYFSPTPGASGIAEGVFAHFFAGLVAGGHLILVVVAWRALTIYLGMIIGIFVVHHELARPRSTA